MQRIQHLIEAGIPFSFDGQNVVVAAVSVGTPSQIQAQLKKRLDGQTQTFTVALDKYTKALESLLKSLGCNLNMGISYQTHSNNSSGMPSISYSVEFLVELPKGFPNLNSKEGLEAWQALYESTKKFGSIGMTVKNGFVTFTPDYKQITNSISYHFS